MLRRGGQHDPLEPREPAVEAGRVLGPQRAQDLDVLVGARAALGGIDAERAELLLHPPGPDAQHEAAVAQDIERGDLRGEVDRVAVGQDQHARAEPHAIGDGADHRQRHQRVEPLHPRRHRHLRPGVAVRVLARALVRAAPRGAPPRPSRTRAARPPRRPAAPSPCRGRGLRWGARRRCARQRPYPRRARTSTAPAAGAGAAAARAGARAAYCGYFAVSAASASGASRRSASTVTSPST